jgi:hypothetical protein
MLALGWEKDRYGHLQKDVTRKYLEPIAFETKRWRCKLQATSCRIEVQHQYSDSTYAKGEKAWLRVSGDYYKNIKLNDKGGIVVGTLTLKAKTDTPNQ